MKNMEIIKTFDGTEALRSDCRRIKGDFYKKDSQCFLMPDGRWHRVNNGKITFDHEKKKWVFLNSMGLVEGVVGIGADGSMERGYFTANNIKNVKILVGRMGENLTCISEDILPKDRFVELLGTDYFVEKGSHVNIGRNNKCIKDNYPFRLTYGAGPKIPIFKEHFDNYYEAPKEGSPDFYKELGNITWGMEFETYNGYIPVRHLYKTGLIPLKDGSLRHDGISPFEFTTIPFSGKKGLHATKSCCDLLQKYTEIGDNCAFHIHVGGYEISKEYVLSVFSTISKLQEELYSIAPSGYKHTAEFKPQNYCSPFPDLPLSVTNSLDENFLILYDYLSCGRGTFNGFNGDEHPEDRVGEHKWRIPTRYHLVNLVPTIWGGRGTVEFRLFPPTQNELKATYQLFIANGILKFAHKHREIISKFDSKNPLLENVDLSSVMRSVYTKELASLLCDYIEHRKDFFRVCTSKGDIEGHEDIKKDSELKHFTPLI